MGIAVRAAGCRRGLLLASGSLAALLIGGGAPSGFAAFPGTFFFDGASTAGVSNSSAIACLDIQNLTISGNVAIPSTGVLTSQSTRTPSPIGIAINNSTIVSQGTNTATAAPSVSGVHVFNKAANVNGINVTTVSTFASGGVSKSGAVSANDSGICESYSMTRQIRL
jgi:hypothetical protein